jgi:phosphoglycolate phosphatase
MISAASAPGPYPVVLFDLDGTLTDPKVGITRSVQHALHTLGILEPDLDRLRPFIGPPLSESFRRFYGFDELLISRAINAYREYFATRGIVENVIYPGISDLLVELSPHCTLGVATSKPTVFAEQILQRFNLRALFSFVIGSHLDDTHTAKGEIIRSALARAPQGSTQNAVMVGDREHDIRAARENSIDSIAVAYGYGSIEELQRAQPTFLARSVDELRTLVNRK